MSESLKPIPFNRPVLLPVHEERLRAAIESGHLSGAGPQTRLCEAQLDGMYGSRTLLVTSGTHALDMSALLLGIEPGDEVILPSFTFVSTANAFVLRGARILFADNDEYGNIRLDELERLRTGKTKAAVIVHYGGNSPDMDPIVDWAGKHGIALVEDAAQAIDAFYKGRPLGGFSALGCLSFHETKNVTAGEGGALIVNRPELVERAEIIREKGTNRAKFHLGLVDKYTWVDVGSSYVLSDLNAAYLAPQLEQLQSITARRRAIWTRYKAALASTLDKAGARCIEPPPYNRPNYHMFAVVLRSGEARSKLIAHLRERKITAPFHYLALHQSPFGQKFSSDALPEAVKLSNHLLRLPLYFNMSDAETDRVISEVDSFLRK